MKGIMKDAFLLFVITLVAGACLGAVHEVTLEPIAKAQLAANTATYKEVFPEAASFEQTDELKAAVEAGAAQIAEQGFGNVSIDAAQEALAEDGTLLGYLITASSNDGYNGLVQIVEMFLKKCMVSLYNALGVFLPLITTNCAVLGVALTNVQNDYTIIESVVNGVATAFGYTVAIVLLAGIRERIEGNDIPYNFQGSPIVLVTAGLMAIAFFGFSGLL